LKTTQDPLRHHFGQYNVGTIDAYQGLVLLAAHGQRHVLQILEIKQHPNFPKQ
jgi:hypothetical protein